MKKIITTGYEIFSDKNGIIHWVVIENAHIDLKAIKEAHKVAIKLNGGKMQYYSLVDSRNYRTFTPESEEYLKTEITSNASATAVFSKNLAVRIQVDLMNTLSKMPTPLRLFDNEKDARKWLLAIKKENEKKKVIHPAFSVAGDKIKTAAYELRLDKNGIVHKNIKADVHIDLKEIKKCHEMAYVMNKGKRMLLLVNAKQYHTLSPQASKYLKTDPNKTRIATAVLTKGLGLGQKMIADSLTKKKGSPPVMLFSKEADAVKWLLSFKKPAAKKASPLTKRKKP